VTAKPSDAKPSQSATDTDGNALAFSAFIGSSGFDWIQKMFLADNGEMIGARDPRAFTGEAGGPAQRASVRAATGFSR
jgi:hypothetical protein